MYDGSLNFGDLLLRLAIELNLALIPAGSDNRFVLPTDPQRLDKLKKTLNTAARQFTNSTRHPVDGTTRRWTWIQPYIEVDFRSDGYGPAQSGEAHRALLPLGVCSAPKGAIAWRNTDDANGGGAVYNVPHDQIELKRASNPDLTGPPLYCAIKSTTSPKLGNRPGVELVIYPAPDRNITVGAKYSVQCVEMIDLSERGIWPGVHDDTVLAFAVHEWKRADGDESAKGRREEALANSFDLDKEMHPKSLGKLSGGGESAYPQVRTPLWNAVAGEYLLT